MIKELIFNICFSFIILISYSTVVLSQINEIDENKLRRHIEVLGSDLFEGRGTGTKGGELAASYIASVFESIGLIPIGDNNSYFQSIPFHGTSFLKGSKLYLYSGSDTLELRIGKDYLLSNSGEQTFIPKAIDLVFVGYGIIAPEYDHNDYLGKDMAGKIAVMLDGEPYSTDPEYFEADEPTIYSYPDVKHRIALSRGAEGTIVIPKIDDGNDQTWKKLVNEYSFEDVRLSYNAANSFGIILNPQIANDLFYEESENTGYRNFRSFNTENISLKFEGDFFVRDFKANNVIGMIQGTNLIDDSEFIIVSAHYDHLGIGPKINGDKIYNGVLDNAVGVSGLIEVARELKQYEGQLERSVIFIATTGEEKGLLGATYYVDHPIVPLYKTVANLNIDGLAFIDDFNSLIGIGAELSNLGDLLKVVAGKNQMNIEKIPLQFYSHESFNRSDQIAFAKAGIPSILLMDAPNYVNIDRQTAVNNLIFYNDKIYHTPFDDLSIQLNYSAMVKHLKILTSFIHEIANSKIEINWNQGVPYNYIRLQTFAEKR